MKVLIVGSEGNMGSRYCAILKHLGVDFSRFDISLNNDFDEAAKGCDRTIIATPTQSHKFDLIKVLKHCQGPTLCEKPLIKNITDLRNICSWYRFANRDLRMVAQYKYAFNDFKNGPSYYNYFKTGKDGLNWDCIQIIGLARGEISIKNESPDWDCAINGTRLMIGDMDLAYVRNIKDWLKNPVDCVGEDEAIRWHEKASKL